MNSVLEKNRTIVAKSAGFSYHGTGTCRSAVGQTRNNNPITTAQPAITGHDDVGVSETTTVDALVFPFRSSFPLLFGTIIWTTTTGHGFDFFCCSFLLGKAKTEIFMVFIISYNQTR